MARTPFPPNGPEAPAGETGKPLLDGAEKLAPADLLRNMFSISVGALPVLRSAKGSPRAKTTGAVDSKVRVDDFVQRVRASTASGTGGRLVFAMDATASREPTWAHARELQAEMFRTTASIGGLEVQLTYYRGLCEFTATPWVKDPDELLARMSQVTCMAGETQIRRVLRHALKEHQARRIASVVFVGDCVEEDGVRLTTLAAEAGLRGLPVFVFQEGTDEKAEALFKDIARLSGGAYAPFDAASAWQLRELLNAVAVFSVGGRRALADYSQGRGETVRLLTHQLGPMVTAGA